MSKKFIIPSLLIVLGASPASAEVWNVMEGTNRAANGTWTVNAAGGALPGTAEMTDAQGRRVTFKLTGSVKNGQYMMQRVAPSNGHNCVYRGDMNQTGKISGSAMCGPASTAWFVTRQ